MVELDVDLVLPGHRRLFSDHRGRIRELQDHHQRRLDEVMTILDDSTLCAYDIASLMTWEIRAASWDHFPVVQQWFATGEAIAHLRYLEEMRQVERQPHDGVIQFHKIERPFDAWGVCDRLFAANN